MAERPIALVPPTLRSRIADLRGRGVYSEYADEFRAIFIHVPKAAGTSISQALFGRRSRHLRWLDYYRANPRKFRSYFKFAFVRNPWDRLVSTFFFLKSGGLNPLDRAWAEQNLAGFDNFETFVLGWLTKAHAQSWVHFKPQYHWICDDHLTPRMDFVGRFEDIEDDFKVIAERLGCARHLEKGNRTEHLHYTAYYTPETMAMVAAVYATDIELFGYVFEGNASRR